MVDIVHRLGIQAPAAKVYAALATTQGLAGWWTRHTSGSSQPGGRIVFAFRNAGGDEVGSVGAEVIELETDRSVRWRVNDGMPEWVGTEIGFLLSSEGGQTIVRFGHRGWREEVEFTAHCSMKWATFLLSLRQLVETGQGQPAPDDLKIDNWN